MFALAVVGWLTAVVFFFLWWWERWEARDWKWMWLEIIDLLVKLLPAEHAETVEWVSQAIKRQRRNHG